MLEYLGYKRTIGAGLGEYYGSKALAAILYQTSLGDFVYTTDSSGNVILDNQGSLGATNDGQIYSGRGLELLATNNLSIPIHHTLGSELFSGTISNYSGGTVTNHGGGSFTIASNSILSAGGSTTLSSSGFITRYYLDVTSITGLMYIKYLDGSWKYKQLTIGINLFEVNNTNTTMLIISQDTNANSVTFNSLSVKQITNPNSYLTYYDFSKSGFVTLGNSVDGGSSANLEKVVNGTFDTTTTGWTATACTISVNNGAMRITDTDGGTGYAQQLVTLVVGKTYMISADIVTDAITGNMYLNVGTSDGGNQQFTSLLSSGTGTLSGKFVATSTAGWVNLKNTSSISGEYWEVDNVTVKEILPISTTYTLNTKTANNFLTHTTQWSASDWTKINNNPNYVGKLALETTGVTKTIPELDMVMDAGASADKWYPCSEKSGGYVVDARSLGSELVTNGTFDSDTTGWTGFTWQSGGTVRAVNTGTWVYGRSTISTVIGETYILSFNYIANTTASNALVRLGTSVGGTTVLNNSYSSSDFGVKLVTFTALSTTTYVQFSSTANTNLTYTEWDDISVHKASAQEISNYAATVRTNADFSQKGLQTTAFVQDGAGIPLSYTSNVLNWNANGYCNHQWNPSLESAFWLEEIVDGVVYQHKYDGTNLTTYTNNVAGTPSLHSPENANYLSGKGVYPKVTADPYTSYQAKTFQLHTGSLYTSYDQSARYTILAAM